MSTLTSEKHYDVVIVGAGFAGAIVARQLAESGKSVLILEAGPGTGLEKDGLRTFVQRYYTEYVKEPNAPYPHSASAPASSLADGFDIPGRPPGYLIQKGPQHYRCHYTRSVGGTTLTWLGTCLRMLPNDFRMKSKYGVGVDWPIDYWNLQPYYERAEWEIGVAANVSEQEFLDGVNLYRAGYDYPMSRVPPSYLDRRLSERIDGLTVRLAGQEYTLDVRSTPAGRNTVPRVGVDPRYPHHGRRLYRPVGDPHDPDHMGQRCEGHASCVPICPVHAKYTALKTLRSAIDNNGSRVDVVVRAVASKIEFDAATGRIEGILYKRYHDPKDTEITEHRARGTVYVVAAHAIETAKLLLASGVANSSDQVGRNLMDHPYLLAWGLMPETAGSYRGPGSTSGIPQMRDGSFRSGFAGFVVEIGNEGWLWPKLAPSSTLDELVDDRDRGLFGAELRAKLADIGPRQFRFGFGVEHLPEHGNRVTIDPRYKDAIGNYRPVVYYRISDYCRRGIAEARRVSTLMFKKIGACDETEYNKNHPDYFEHDGEPLQTLGPGHGAGTHRMGISRHDSVINSDQQAWDHENLYLVGCGNFCTIGTANPTLTLAALAFRAAEKIIRDLC